MSTESWLDDNNRYLAASLQWLRLRLQRLMPEEPVVKMGAAAPPAVPSPAASEPFWRRLAGGPSGTQEVPLLPPAKSPALDELIKKAAAERDAAANVDPPPALLLLAERLGLSTFERDALLLCAAVEFDPGLVIPYAETQGNPVRNYPTFGLALAALDDPSWDALSAHRPLRYARLIEISQPGATPLTSSALRADERIVNFIKGLNVLDDRLATLLNPVTAGPASLAASQQALVETILQRLHDAISEMALPVVQLLGVDPGSKLDVACQVCASLNRRLYRIGTDALPQQAAEVEALARLWQRESFLLPVALYVDAENIEGVSVDTQAAYHRFLSRGVGLVFVGVRETPIKFSGASLSVEVNKPTAAEQCHAWTSLLDRDEAKPEHRAAAEFLAGQFSLNLSEIRDVFTQVQRAQADDKPLSEQLWDRCRDLARPKLDSLAQRLDVKATWSDLVLPSEQTALLQQIVAQVRQRHKVYEQWGFAEKMNRGFGISALFAGESGVGKSMAAEVIANALRLNLYRIDLSAVVSKYIGETEKNLRKLFDAAEQGGAILFFDEADALFGKRSEVKDSHDRYANIEINYLLQRMEAFSGLAILGTNMKTALDLAFMRRLRFIVNFPFPGVKERKLIWEKVLPENTLKEGLDFDRLARLNLSGGNILSIALNAAFQAAEKNQAVTMPILVSATRTELRKLEKPDNEAELRRLETAASA